MAASIFTYAHPVKLSTESGEAFGVPRVSLIETGLYNFHSWALLAVVIFAIVTGFGRQSDDRSA